MADVICRWRNPSPKTVVELVSLLPKKPMSSKEFRDFVEAKEDDFFHTPYQLACQLGLYYEGKDGFIPRFARDITIQEAQDYLEYWVRRYYAPNPFTRSLTSLEEPVLLVESLVQYLEDHGGSANLNQALTDIFKDPMGNLDIVTNTLNQYSKVIKVANDTASLSVNYKQIMESLPNRKDKKAFFFFFDADAESEAAKNNGTTIQTIYYGCPGTGKSHQVKELTEGLREEKVIKFDDGTINVFRTTFHPDYDYATFVGCYKPVKENDKLDYKFVPQVFTNAYVTAKKHPETPIYLIIEEINRGNCAQIFGDLFQLLDRENGVSKFPIDAEEELMKYLRDEAQLDDYIKIKLPANFNIYATMNTSDQSLFPMDSAFKRRWEMKYIKINYTEKEADYTFKVNGADYHWLEYLPCINDKITLATDSEDKQMGEFFIRSNMNATEFKNKVMFYLWNDVCKDLYAGNNSPQSFFFRDLYGKPFKFTELFNELPEDAKDEDKKDPRKNGDLLLEGFLYYVKFGKKKAPKTEAITEQVVEESEDGGEQPAE